MTRVRHVAGEVGIGVGGIAAVTLVCFPLHVQFAIPAFLYLLTIVLRSAESEFASSAIVSLVAVLCLDYFFTPPVLQLEVASPIDGVALLTCLITSLVITRLAAEARQKTLWAERRRAALARLYEVVWRLFSIEPQAVSVAGTLRIYREVIGMEAICLFDGKTGRMEIAGGAHERLADLTRGSYTLGCDDKNEALGTWVQCLQVAGRCVGAIGFQGLQDAEWIAAPLSTLAAASLERAESFQAASDAAAASQLESLRAAIVDAFAHHFKTPLAAILAAAGGIRETRPLTAQQLEMIEMIEAESVRLGKLATRLLVTARLDRDEVQPRLEPTNLPDLVAQIVDQWPAEAHRVSIERGDERIEVAADQELLTLALAQLLENGLKYSQANHAVRIELGTKDGAAIVRVRNEGSFVPPFERERIFERFYRGAASGGVAAGSGLGLYVARKIVLAHGGSLDLAEYGPYGEQTTFCLTLPLLINEATTRCP